MRWPSVTLTNTLPRIKKPDGRNCKINVFEAEKRGGKGGVCVCVIAEWQFVLEALFLSPSQREEKTAACSLFLMRKRPALTHCILLLRFCGEMAWLARFSCCGGVALLSPISLRDLHARSPFLPPVNTGEKIRRLRRHQKKAVGRRDNCICF